MFGRKGRAQCDRTLGNAGGLSQTRPPLSQKRPNLPLLSSVALVPCRTGQSNGSRRRSGLQPIPVVAARIGVPVPETVLGVVNGKTIAISKSWGAKSLDVPTIMQASPGDAALTAALRAASGLLAFHAWLGTDDLKDQHLVVRGPTPGHYEVASIDFAGAALWRGDAQDTVALPGGPPALLANRDPAVIEQTVARIESTADEAITVVVSSLPDEVLPAAERERISRVLVARKGTIRAVFRNAGWLTV